MNNSIANIIKISFLSIVGFGIIVYLTASKPIANVSSLPPMIHLLNEKVPLKTDAVLRTSTIVAIANHDSIALLKDLPSLVDFKGNNFVLIANVSPAPWFVKEFIIPSKLQELKGASNTPFILDNDGLLSLFFKHLNNDKKYYSIHFIDKSNNARFVVDGNVSDGDLERGLSVDEKIVRLKNAIDSISRM